MARAVVLVSGGLDSATTLAVARSQGFATYALSVDYGQRHRRELECARRVAAALGAARHTVVSVDLRAVGGSALTDTLDVPKDRSHDEIGQGIPVTYVPARNTVLLSLALGYAEVVGAFDLFIGANAIDYCVPGSMTVLTDQGLKSVAELAVGDRVLSHGPDGMTWQPVILHGRSPHQERLLRIRCGGNLFECTPNHHMVKVEYDKKHRMLRHKRIVHVQARDLAVGDYLLTPAQPLDADATVADRFDFGPYIPLVQWAEERLHVCDDQVGRITGVRNYLPLQCDLRHVLTLLAWYVTEGWMTNCNGVCISQTNQEHVCSIVGAIQGIGLKAHVTHKRGDTNQTIFCSHPVLSAWFRTLGTRARDKRLPDWCLRLPNRYLEVLFEVLVKGDGSWQRQARMKGRPYDHYYSEFHSASETLLNQVIYVGVRLGYRASMQRCRAGVYSVRFSKPRSRMIHGASLIKVTAIEETPNVQPLYDFTVDKNHTFVGGTHGFIIAGQSGYPDCRPEFLAQFERLANLATQAAVEGRGTFRVHAPLLRLTKAEIIHEGVRLGVDYGLTLSCYDPDAAGRACGRCDSCRLRLKGFQEAELKDPAAYQ